MNDFPRPEDKLAHILTALQDGIKHLVLESDQMQLEIDALKARVYDLEHP